MRSITIFILTISACIQSYGQNRDYIFEQISSDAGITFNAISTIVEDNYGFIWFGSGNGLYYYNTSELITYNFDPENLNSPPSDHINKLYKDQTGRIWICTDNGICYFNEEENSFIRLQMKESDEFLHQLSFNSVLQYSDEEFLIVANDRLFYFNLYEQIIRAIDLVESDALISYLGQTEDGQIFVGSDDGQVFLNTGSLTEFRQIYKSKSGAIRTLCSINNRLWLGLNSTGIEVISTEGRHLRRYLKNLDVDNQISKIQVREIIQRENGEIWIASTGGIYIIGPNGIQILEQDSYNGIPHIGVFDLYIDKNDGVWVGTWSGGLAYYHESNYKFPHIQKIVINDPLSKSVVSSFIEDSEGLIWVGSENFGITIFDPEALKFVDSDPYKSNFPISRIKTIAKDKNNSLWFGTMQEGLWKIDQGKFRKTKPVSGIISSILAAENGIWIGYRESGLIYYDTKNNTTTKFLAGDKKIGSISSNQIWNLYTDSKENLWICSDFGISLKKKNEVDFQRFFYNANSNSISRNKIYTICEDQNGKMWIGTSGAGIDIYDAENNSFNKFRLNSSIENAEVYSIIEDMENNMWFSTNQGIYMYNTRDNTLQRFTEEDGLLGQQFHPNSGFISSSGLLFFGGGNGFNVIDPSTVRVNQISPEVYLSKLLINSLPFSEQNTKYVNSKFVASINSIELKHDQNTLTMSFVANNYIKSSNNKFRYRIENYLDEWHEVNHGSDVSFTKFPPGDYILEVQTSINDDKWSASPKLIDIKILPPFWRTWYAFLFYSVLVIGIIFIVIRQVRFMEKSRADRSLFSEKVQFFTNVSHEFRTPLTLIISPLNNLINKFVYDPVISDQIQIIKRNADRLLRLTNQILDFRLIELNKAKLKIEEEDIISLSRNVYECFEYQMIEKEINCIFTSSFKTLRLAVDPEKIEKVIYNLLSNAIKYSFEKGQIILSIEQKTMEEQSYSEVFYTGEKFFGDSIEIKVKDSGMGIKPEILPHIFERFIVDQENKETGTGIGLHICQEYIRLHKGNIMVNSKIGKASIFAVNIPVTSIADYEEEDVIIQYHFDKIRTDSTEIQIEADHFETNKVLLFAEDNDDMRVYFKNLLSSKYRVLTAKNGKQAYEIAKEVVPDIIISDILMPGMTGIELCAQIRNRPNTSHIPIILLTALSDEKHKIESMQEGADTFLTKPVDEAFLFAKIENIFTNRETLKNKYEAKKDEHDFSPKINESFINKAEQIIENNLQNKSFEISEFADQLNISKSSLQRKMKTAVNLSPTEFIRDERLKKAVSLMKQGNLNIDEIAILVGFNSTSYFIRTFKKKYGKTPTAFKADSTNEEEQN